MQISPQLAPANLRSYNIPNLETSLDTSTFDKLKKIETLKFGEFVAKEDFNLRAQVVNIKEFERRQDDTYSVREHRLKSLGYAAGAVFLVVIAGMTPKFPNMTKTYRIASAIISGLAVLVSTTKAYTATKKWSSENCGNKDFYWIPIYNEIRYIYTAFLAKSSLDIVHSIYIYELNENLGLCKSIDENWEEVEQTLEEHELDPVGNVIAVAKSLIQAANQEAEAAKEQKLSS